MLRLAGARCICCSCWRCLREDSRRQRHSALRVVSLQRNLRTVHRRRKIQHWCSHWLLLLLLWLWRNASWAEPLVSQRHLREWRCEAVEMVFYTAHQGTASQSNSVNNAMPSCTSNHRQANRGHVPASHLSQSRICFSFSELLHTTHAVSSSSSSSCTTTTTHI